MRLINNFTSFRFNCLQPISGDIIRAMRNSKRSTIRGILLIPVFWSVKAIVRVVDLVAFRSLQGIVRVADTVAGGACPWCGSNWLWGR